MAEAGETDMSRQAFSVAYDGKSRADDHSIDVQTLAPTLMAFSRLLREANSEFNGKNVSAKVLVLSDFEHKCFNINFELALGLIEKAKTLLDFDSVKTAKEILEWIGLLKTPVIGAGAILAGRLTYLKYLEWKRGRAVIEDKTEVDQTGMVKVTIKGDNNSVHVHPTVLNLSKNPKALRATRDAFLPLGGNGFDIMRVSDLDAAMSDEFSPEVVSAIAASCSAGIEESEEADQPDVEETSAWITVYSPVYDAKADKWRFRHGREVVYADIADTTIAQDAVARGGSLADDAYQVVLEITTEYDANGKPKAPSYKIKRVVRFVPATLTKQDDLFDPERV